MFWEKYNKYTIILDLSGLLPCKDSLHYHMQRANYVRMQIVETVLKCYGDDCESHSTWFDRQYGCNVGEHATP